MPWKLKAKEESRREGCSVVVVHLSLLQVEWKEIQMGLQR